MIGKKNAPYSSARRAQNQQTADAGSWMRRMVGMETPSERKAKEQAEPKPKADPNVPADQFGGMTGGAVKAIRNRRKAMDDAINGQ
jgi:hypothetical protein